MSGPTPLRSHGTNALLKFGGVARVHRLPPDFRKQLKWGCPHYDWLVGWLLIIRKQLAHRWYFL